MVRTKERTYNIPLRREVQKVAEWDRTSKAVKATRKFLVRHMKVEESNDVKLGQYLNKELHSRGRKHPPHHVKVNVYEEEGKVFAELVGAPEKKVETPKEEAKPKVTVDAKKADEKKAEEAKVKKEILEKPVAKEKEVKASKVPKDKEADVKMALEDRATRDEKPKNEPKK